MITRIESIKDFGIYKNFNWSSSPDIRDFNYKNIFYGWNYSGKTTLSRIFSSLKDRKLHESYENGFFKIKSSDGDFDSNNLEAFPYDLLVFNSDYIKDNLNFSFNKNDISDSKTILFEVGDNAKYQVKIDELKKQINLINGTDTIIEKKAKYISAIDEFDAFDKSSSGKFTILAKEIKDNHFISLINFTKTNLKPIVTTVKDNLTPHIIVDSKRLSQLSEIVKTSEPKVEIDDIEINFNYTEIINKTNKILSSIPNKNKLDKNNGADGAQYSLSKAYTNVEMYLNSLVQHLY